MPKTILLLFLLITFQTQAGLGPEISRSQIPHNLCLLDFSNKTQTSFNGVCSGVLINSSTILTAAHCLTREMPQTIRCGNDLNEVEFESNDYTIHPEYKKDIIVDNVGMHLNDIATIKLKKPIAIRPLDLISLDAIDDKTTCGFFGFSQFIGKSKSDIDSEARGWAIDQATVRLNMTHNFLQMEGLKAPGGLLQVGDSGGPLMCLQNGQWNLMGINSSRDFFSRSNFMAINEMDFVKIAKSLFKNTYLESDLRILEQKELLLHDMAKLQKEIERLKEDNSSYLNQLNQIKLKFNSSSSYHQIKEMISSLKESIVSDLISQNNFALRLKAYSKINIHHISDKKSIGDLVYNYFLIESKNLKAGTVTGKLRTIGPSDNFLCTGELICASKTIENVRVSIKDFEIYKIQASKVFK